MAGYYLSPLIRRRRQPQPALRLRTDTIAAKASSVLAMHGGQLREFKVHPQPSVNGGTPLVDGFNAMSFSGASSYVAATRPAGITSTSAWTLVMHTRFTGTLSLTGIFNLGDAGIGYWWSSGNGILIASESADISYTAELAVNPDVTAWHRWTFLTEGNAIRPEIWCDGIPITAVGTANLSLDAASTYDLARGLGGEFYSVMQVEMALLFDFALRETEIWDLTSQPGSMWEKTFSFSNNRYPVYVPPPPVLGPALRVTTTGMRW